MSWRHGHACINTFTDTSCFRIYQLHESFLIKIMTEIYQHVCFHLILSSLTDNFIWICVYSECYNHVHRRIQTSKLGPWDLFVQTFISSKQINESVIFTSKFIAFTQMGHSLHNLLWKNSSS